MNPQQPQRKPTRLNGFDYGCAGAYFITICTHNRSNILSRIVGEGSPLPQLSCYGAIADKWIRQIPIAYPGIEPEVYVVMPNHIHLLLSVTDNNGRGDPSPTVTAAVGWFKYQVTKEINARRHTPGERVFQRSFYDHVLRHPTEYQEIYTYICENPLRWQQDALYTAERSNHTPLF